MYGLVTGLTVGHADKAYIVAGLPVQDGRPTRFEFAIVGMRPDYQNPQLTGCVITHDGFP
jgi:hypothetical protein